MSQLPEELQNEGRIKLSAFLNQSVEISGGNPVGGGSINHAAKIQTNHGDFFVKWNKSEAFPQMFYKEQLGLKLLSTGDHIRVPEVIAADELTSVAYLLTEWIESGSETESFWKLFGEKLAALHRETSDKFGLDHDNYMGSLQQSNSRESSWSEFFINQRLEPQIQMAVDAGFSFASTFHHIFKVLEADVPKEQPSLIHGDLWSGNFMADANSLPVLIDPAAYFGHRESDIAMTTLFGGFSQDFYKFYNSAFTLENGWQERIPLHNLYPLLVHVNLFGSGYVNQVNQILRKFK